MNNLLNIFPDCIKEQIINLGSIQITEIRLRTNRYIFVKSYDKEFAIKYMVSSQDLMEILKKVSSNSIYSIQNSINNGYITAPGGNRIGIVGEVVMEGGKIKNIKNISSMNIRIANEMIGCSNKIIDKVYINGQVLNCLIVSPPRSWQNNHVKRCD